MPAVVLLAKANVIFEEFLSHFARCLLSTCSGHCDGVLICLTQYAVNHQHSSRQAGRYSVSTTPPATLSVPLWRGSYAACVSTACGRVRSSSLLHPRWRRACLPATLTPLLQHYLARVKTVHQQELAQGHGVAFVALCGTGSLCKCVLKTTDLLRERHRDNDSPSSAVVVGERGWEAVQRGKARGTSRLRWMGAGPTQRGCATVSRSYG